MECLGKKEFLKNSDLVGAKDWAMSHFKAIILLLSEATVK
jgi:hypothetical protein